MEADVMPEAKRRKIEEESQNKGTTDEIKTDAQSFKSKEANGNKLVGPSASGDIPVNPVPSTSGTQCVVKGEVEKEDTKKKYKHSVHYLQYQWAKQRPEFLRLKEELSNKYK